MSLDEVFHLPLIFVTQQAAGRVEDLARRLQVFQGLGEDVWSPRPTSLRADDSIQHLLAEFPLEVGIAADGASPWSCGRYLSKARRLPPSPSCRRAETGFSRPREIGRWSSRFEQTVSWLRTVQRCEHRAGKAGLDSCVTTTYLHKRPEGQALTSCTGAKVEHELARLRKSIAESQFSTTRQST